MRLFFFFFDFSTIEGKINPEFACEYCKAKWGVVRMRRVRFPGRGTQEVPNSRERMHGVAFGKTTRKEKEGMRDQRCLEQVFEKDDLAGSWKDE